MTEAQQNIAWGLCVAILAFLLLIVNVGHPDVLIFDETHYVPNAREILAQSENSNTFHPMFAKTMIAAGIIVFGDNAFGWRFFGVLVSSLGLLALFDITRRLTKSRLLAGLLMILSLTSVTVTIQARAAMLDTYSHSFLMISAFFLIWSLATGRSKNAVYLSLFASGIFLGLAAGSKWIDGIYAFLTLLFLFGVRLFSTLQAKRPVYDALFGRNYTSLPQLSFFSSALIVGITGLIIYFVTFWPIFFWETDPVAPLDLFAYQLEMFETQKLPLPESKLETEWWQWPLQINPIWYHFFSNKAGNHEVIFYVGNPIVHWGGLIAVAILFVHGVWKRSQLSFFTALAFLSSWLIFGIIPKQVGFQYYYHGSSTLLCLMIPVALSLLTNDRHRKIAIAVTAIASTAFFIYFLPVVYALEMPPHKWTQYVWFDSWL